MSGQTRLPDRTGDTTGGPGRHLLRLLSLLAALTAAFALTTALPAPAGASIGFTAKTDLAGRDAKTTSATEVRTYPSGSTVQIVCQDRGEFAYGSSVWNKTTDGLWVVDEYLYTGYDGFHPDLPRCSDIGQDGHVFTALADLNGRATPYLSGRTVQENMYRQGEAVTVVCQTTGGEAYGSTVWDKTTENVYVADHYVDTDHNGFHPDVPRCEDGIPDSFGFTAKTDLAGRNGRSLSGTEVRTYPSGSTVQIVCQAVGENAYGSNIWNKTTDGLWVTDYYLYTGYYTFHPGVPRCDDGSFDSRGFTAKTDLAGRDARTTSATEVKTYAGGSTVQIVCQTTGEEAYGSNIWNKTTDGLWVVDHYLYTGYDGFHPDLPRCDEETSGAHSFRAKTDLAGRDAKTTSATEVRTYADGTMIDVVCQATGEEAYGSDIWNKTTDGLWVVDHYLYTGYDGFHPDVPRCDPDDGEPDGGTGGGYTAKTDLAGRDAKTTSATEVKTYAEGSTIEIVCQAYGESAYGSYIWDQTSDGLWVTDRYVYTGTDGFISGMPRCDDDVPTDPDGSTAPEPGDCSVGHGRTNGPRGSTGGTPEERIQRVIDTARSQIGQGYSYSWGAGGKGGATCGIDTPSPGGSYDYNRLGFDCSGLTLYAFWKGAGVDIGMHTGAQYHDQVNGGSARQVPYAERKPGDLIFWGNSPQSTTHVAIYIGNDQIIESSWPRNADSVHVREVYGDTLPNVVRYIE